MKVAVIGSRTFNDYPKLEQELNSIPSIKIIISGGASGADKLSEVYADSKSIETLIIKPDWKRYSRGAGAVRNTEIVENADYVVAFWDGKSKGTLDSINKCKKKNIKLKIVEC